jgi:hypothetical protein
MAKSNLNQQGKRQRALAKQDKRAAKDEKRAQKKAEARAERGIAPAEPAPSATSVAAAAFIRSMKIRG